jgi:molybdate transport system regulatory protein
MNEEIPSFRLGLKMWITGTGPSAPRSLFGQGDILLLKSLVKTLNLTQSSKDLNYSYKYAWQKLQELSKKTGKKVVNSSRGGYKGGGTMIITTWGKYLIQIFDEVSSRLNTYHADLNQYLEDHPFNPINPEKI